MHPTKKIIFLCLVKSDENGSKSNQFRHCCYQWANSKLNQLLDEKIDEKTLAKYIRRVAYILSLTIIRNDENQNPIDKDWADNGFYWLNELAEVLDPVLDLEA